MEHLRISLINISIYPSLINYLFVASTTIKILSSAQFIAVALDEGPGPTLHSPCAAELTKLYSVVGILVRYCDVTLECKEAVKRCVYIHTYMYVCINIILIQDEELLVNPYADAELCVKLPNDLHHCVFERTVKVCWSIYLSIYLSMYLSICLSVVYNMVYHMLRR